MNKYTHRDNSGMSWRMNGSGPVSALADRVMYDVGLPCGDSYCGICSKPKKNKKNRKKRGKNNK